MLQQTRQFWVRFPLEECLIFSLTRSGKETKRFVELSHSTSNASRIQRNLGNGNVLMKTEYLKVPRFPLSTTLWSKYSVKPIELVDRPSYIIFIFLKSVPCWTYKRIRLFKLNWRPVIVRQYVQTTTLQGSSHHSLLLNLTRHRLLRCFVIETCCTIYTAFGRIDGIFYIQMKTPSHLTLP